MSVDKSAEDAAKLGTANECWAWNVVKVTLRDLFGDGFFIFKGVREFNKGTFISDAVHEAQVTKANDHGIMNLVVGVVNSHQFTAHDLDHSPQAQFHCNAVDFSKNAWYEPFQNAQTGQMRKGRNKIVHRPHLDQNVPYLIGGEPCNRWYHFITAIYDFKMCRDGKAKDIIEVLYPPTRQQSGSSSASTVHSNAGASSSSSSSASSAMIPASSTQSGEIYERIMASVPYNTRNAAKRAAEKEAEAE